MTVTNPNPETGCVGGGGGGGGGVEVACCTNTIPTTLKATFTNVSDCACADGVEITLTYDAFNDDWRSGFVALGTCGANITLILDCPPEGSSVAHWTLDLGECDVAAPPLGPGSTCDPLLLIFDWVETDGDGSCCDTNPGSATIIITE